MDATQRQTWRRGEIYELILLVGITVSVWACGELVGLFAWLEHVMVELNFTKLVLFGFMMSFVLSALSVFKSLRLRRSARLAARAERDARNLARHDAMTGLPNRRLLSETIETRVGDIGAEHRLAVFLIDLDRFKPVNDTHGHAAGDAVIYEIGARLTALIDPQAGMVARLGGDEFGAILPYETSVDELEPIARAIIAAVAEPIVWQHALVEIGATVGIALVEAGRDTADELLRCADIAMYCGKREGRSTFRIFEQGMDEELQARAALESGLRAAVANHEIKPFYQALVKLPGEELIGFEVLARWLHPERGIIPPDVFIPMAESIGLISDLSFRLLRQACLDAQSWPPHLSLAVNVSPVQLEDRLLAPRILALLAEMKFPPSRLEIEVTESALASDLDLARSTLQMLQAAGVSIALDDFGTGYSSLCNLREIQFDKIKIDRSFVQTLGENEESSKIVSAIVGLGRSLGIKTTAEGIETVCNSDWLAHQGCTTGQGFLFGRPVPASTIDRMFAGELDGSDAQAPQAA